MSRAYKCDSCGEYCDDEPMIINLVPPALDKKVLKYDLCPFCADAVIRVIAKEKVFGDLEEQ